MISSLEDAGEQLLALRSQFMRERGLGLTQTYNLLLDPERTDSNIAELRKAHKRLEQAVVEAYGWSGISVPEYQRGATPEFVDAVMGRLFALNVQRSSPSVQEGKPGLRRTQAVKGPGTRKAKAVTTGSRRKLGT